MVADMILSLDGQHFKRQYLLYIIEIIHENDCHYYIGQTGDHNYITARPAFRRLAGHLEDTGRSTQNQIYRYLAVRELGILEADRKGSNFDEKTKQAVEDFLITSTIRMHVYSLQGFVPGIEHKKHLEIVRKVTLLEQIVITLFMNNGKRIANKKIPKSLMEKECPYPEILKRIKDDFKLN